MKKNNTLVKEFANIVTEAYQPVKPWSASAPVGEICMANASQFIEGTYSEPLTAYTVNWNDGEGLKDTLEFVAPAVPAADRFEFARFNNAEAFMSEGDDIRGIGGEFKLVTFSSEKVLAKTLNKGLMIRVDEQSVKDQPGWRERYVGMLMNRLTRNDLRRAIGYLIAAGTVSAKTWSTGSVDPDQDIMEAAEAFSGNGTTNGAGIYPNRVVWGSSAWTKRRKGVRAQNVAGAYQSAMMRAQEVAESCELQEGLVSKERYQSANATPNKGQIVGNYAIVFLARKGMTLDDPSNIKRFVTATDGGTAFKVWEQKITSHIIELSVEHYSNVIVTANVGLQVLAVS